MAESPLGGAAFGLMPGSGRRSRVEPVEPSFNNVQDDPVTPTLARLATEPGVLDKMEQQQKVAKGFLENLQAGFQAGSGSVSGNWFNTLFTEGGKPTLVSPSDVSQTGRQDMTWYEAFARGAGQMVGDAPHMAVGGVAGAVAGALGGGLLGPVGGAIGGRAGAGYGGMALPAAVRAYYAEAFTKGEVRDSADFWARFPHIFSAANHEGMLGILLTVAPGAAAMGKLMAGVPGIGAKGAAAVAFGGAKTGEAVVKAGGMTGAQLAAAEATMASLGTRATQLAAEYGAFVGGPALLEGRLPEPVEFLDAAIFLGAIKGGIGAGQGALKGVRKLRDIYEETGALPLAVARDARVEPSLLLDMDSRTVAEKISDQRMVSRETARLEAERTPEEARTPEQAALVAEGRPVVEGGSQVLGRALDIMGKPDAERTPAERAFLDRVRDDPIADGVSLTPAERATVHDDVVAELKRLGRSDIGVALQDQVLGGRADAIYDRSVITLALDTPAEMRPGVINHEAIHAFGPQGMRLFTEAEWSALERAAARWVDDPNLRGDGYTTRERYAAEVAEGRLTDVQVLEEAIADANRALREGRIQDRSGVLQTVMAKIHDFLEALGNALRGNGFRTGLEVLREVQAGEIGRREAQPIAEDGLVLARRRVAGAETHRREKTTGRYVGAPDWVGSSTRNLNRLRTKLRQLAEEGEPGRYWYEQSSREILAMTGGDKVEAEKIVALLAIFSPQRQVPGNTTMALTAWYQYHAGLPIKVGTERMNTIAERVMSGAITPEETTGIKRNSFYQNLMVEIDPSKLDPGTATMDMWMALAFDYGSLKLDQGPKYTFAEREVKRLAAEMGWSPHQVQASIWTAMKGRVDPIREKLKASEARRGWLDADGEIKPEHRYDHFRLAHKMGMEYDLKSEDIARSKLDFGDALRDRMMQISWEATPGVSTGQIPGIHRAPFAQKMEYLVAMNEVLAPGGRDLIAEMAGVPQGRLLLGVSAWEGAVGAGAQTFVPVPLEGSGRQRAAKPVAQDALALYGQIRGYVLSQDMVVWHTPIFSDIKARHNGVEVRTARAWTPEEVSAFYSALNEKFGTWDLAPGYNDTGVRVLNFVDGIDNARFQAGVREVVNSLGDDFGGGEFRVAGYRSEGGYAANNWAEAPNGEVYRGYIDQRRPDLQARVEDLRTRAQTVNADFAAKYGWDRADGAEPGPTLFSPDARASLRAPGFYSELERRVAQAPIKESAAKGWKDYLKGLLGKGQVRQAELDAVGINEFLDLREGKISRDEVRAFVEQNGVRVDETVLGEPVNVGEISPQLQAYIHDFHGRRTPQDSASWTSLADRIFASSQRNIARGEKAAELLTMYEEATRIAERYETGAPEPHYAQYQLPGGESYRELLLQLPPRSMDIRGAERFLRGELNVDPRTRFATDEQILAEAIGRGFVGGDVRDFTAPHFGGMPNILAHVRFNERIDADGKRVLFLEELQSDWAQKGRDVGFQKPLKEITELPEGYTVTEGRVSLNEGRKRFHINEEYHRTLPELQQVVSQMGAAEKEAMIPAYRQFQNYIEPVSRVAVTTEDQASRNFTRRSKMKKPWPEFGDDPTAFFDWARSVLPGSFPPELFADGKTRAIFRVMDREGKEVASGRNAGEATSAVLKRLNEEQIAAQKGAVPSAPFVAKTESWVALAMKRVIRYAAENGFDRVAWTTGEQQAQRWHMAQVVSEINWGSAGMTTGRRVSIDLQQGGQIRFRTDNGRIVGVGGTGGRGAELEGKTLIEVVGKDIAEKIEADAEGTLAGEGLSVGGTGHRTFYDRIVPNVANDVLKKMGGERVNASEIVTGSRVETFDASTGAMSEAATRTQQLGFDITPRVAERALEGQPLMSKRAPSEAPSNIPQAYRPLLDKEILENAFPTGIDKIKIADLIKNPRGAVPDEKTPNYINFRYVKGPDALKSLYAAISEQFTREIEEGRQSPTTWNATFGQARDLINSDGTINSQTLRQAVSSVVLQAASLDVMKSAQRLIETNSPDNVVAHEGNMMMLVAAYAHDQGVGADSARALNLRKAMNESAATAEELIRGSGQFRGETGGMWGIGAQQLNPVELAKMLRTLQDKTPRQLADTLTKMQKATAYEWVIEAWKAGLVSGFFTHATNLVGTGTHIALQPLMNALAGAAGMIRGARVGFEEGQRISLREPIYQIIGMFEGVKQGWKDAHKALFEIDQTGGKAEIYREAIPARAGRIIRTPFRLLSAEDAFLSSVVRRGEMMRLAVREAIAKGDDIESRELTERVNTLLDGTHPDAQRFQAQVEEAVRRFTFNTPLGEKGAAIQGMVNKVKLHFVAPFIRTPINILEEMLRMTPVAPFLKSWQQDVAAGGIRRDRALAEVFMGTSTAALVFLWAIGGDDEGKPVITGAGHPDPGKRRTQRATGIQPYSIRIGDTWYSYQKLQPLGTLIGMVADAAEVWDAMSVEESDKVWKMIQTAFANAITNQTFLQGMTGMARALDPQHPGTGSQMVRQFVSSLVPMSGLVGQTAAVMDPYVREVNSILDAVQNRIPGMREDLLPKLDIFGQPIEMKERLLGVLPVTETEVSTDPVRTEAARLGLSAAPTPRKLHVGRGTGKLGDVELSPEQRHEYARVSGEFAHSYLSKMVESPGWDATRDEVKRKIFQRVFAASHRMGALAALPPEERQGILLEAVQQMQEALQQ